MTRTLAVLLPIAAGLALTGKKEEKDSKEAGGATSPRAASRRERCLFQDCLHAASTASLRPFVASSEKITLLAIRLSRRSPEFRAFRNKYLLVYCVVMLADWLQGTNMSRAQRQAGSARQFAWVCVQGHEVLPETSFSKIVPRYLFRRSV